MHGSLELGSRQWWGFVVACGSLRFISLIFIHKFVYLFVWFFKTDFLCVTAQVTLKLIFVDQAGLELIEICLPLPPECWD